MIHPEFSQSAFIITPRAILFLMMRQAEGGLDFLHGENVVAEDEPTPQNGSQNFLPSRRKGVAGGT